MVASMDRINMAAPEAVEQHAATTPTAWWECRDTGHAFVKHWAGYGPDEKSFLRIRRCRNCKTKKTQVLDLDGYILASEYEYPEGYTLPKGTGRLGADGRAIYRQGNIVTEIEHRGELAERRRSKAA